MGSRHSSCTRKPEVYPEGVLSHSTINMRPSTSPPRQTRFEARHPSCVSDSCVHSSHHDGRDVAGSRICTGPQQHDVHIGTSFHLHRLRTVHPLGSSVGTVCMLPVLRHVSSVPLVHMYYGRPPEHMAPLPHHCVAGCTDDNRRTDSTSFRTNARSLARIHIEHSSRPLSEHAEWNVHTRLRCHRYVHA